MPDGTGAPIAPQAKPHLPKRSRRTKRHPRRTAWWRKYLRRRLSRIAPLTKLGGRMGSGVKTQFGEDIPAQFVPSPAVLLLRRIIEGADLIRGVRVRGERFLLVTLDNDTFLSLCHFEASAEDMEHNGDSEWSVGSEELEEQCEDEGASDGQDDEPSLGSQDAVMDQTHWGEPADTWPWQITDGEPNGDEEPSLGSCDGIVNQERWHDGHRGNEERDTCDDEANGDDEPGDEREPSLVAAEGANVNLRALPWEPEADTYQPPEKMAAARARYVAAMVKP